MFAMGLLAGYWKRTLDTPTALSLSAAIILMGNPFYIGQSSFLLSFLAILAIAVFQPALKECLALINPYHFPLSRLLDSSKFWRLHLLGSRRAWRLHLLDSRRAWRLHPLGSRRAWRLRHLDLQKVTGGCHELLKKAGNGLQSSFSVWIVTLPVQLFFFSEVSLFGIFFNLLIIPLMGVILLLGIAGLFLKEIFHLFAFLLLLFIICFIHRSISLQPYRFPHSYSFSAILSLALRERGLRSISSLSGTITLLFTRRKGVCTFPKKSFSALPSMLPVFMMFFTMRSSSE